MSHVHRHAHARAGAVPMDAEDCSVGRGARAEAPTTTLVFASKPF
jgi:hypothetical protein